MQAVRQRLLEKVTPSKASEDSIKMGDKSQKVSSNETAVDVTTDARVLFDAVRRGKTHLVRFILEASDVDIVNSRDLHGKTPLMACCYTKEEGARDNTVKLLLRHGADINYTDDFGRTVLSYVCEKRCNDILRILIKEHNVDPDIADCSGNTPLIYSAMVGNDIACDILIRHFRRLGLNVDASNEEGFTALLVAAKQGHITCAQILAGQGKASLRHVDTKYGLTVEEWLAKKGFSLSDITPVRHDGKGRTRFLRLANIAAICTAPKAKSVSQAQNQDDMDFGGFMLARDDDYLSDGTTATDLSFPEKYLNRFNELDLDMAMKHYRVFPARPKLKNQETQTIDDLDDMDFAAETDRVALKPEQKDIEKTKKSKQRDNKKESKTSIEGTVQNKEKRYSLPDIDTRAPGQSIERKQSLDVLPEKLIASIELGDGRRHSIQLHADTSTNKVYWSPYKEGEDGEEAVSPRELIPLKFDRPRISVSDSETSTTDDGPIF